MRFENNTIDHVKLALLAMQRYPWEQGVTMQAFLEQGDRDVVIALAKEAVYRALPDGRLATIGVTNAVTDPCATGEALLYACKQTNDAALCRGRDGLLEWALHKAPRNAQGIVYHLTDSDEFWVDSMYMLPPFLAAAGYPKEALQNLYGYWNTLYNEDKQLLHHIWDDKRQAFTRSAYWGVGNGWTLAAFARMIELLPQELEADRENLRQMARKLIDGLLRYIRPDGLFFDVVDDKTTFVETNLSQMLAYTLYRGMKSGWLPASMEPTASRLRNAAAGKVDKYGLVQGVCGAPSFDKSGVAPEGQAFYLLMEAAAAGYYQ
ncbi:MAG: glycoside hydrolase family 88 protein [Acetanaerobacterium sp.]